MKNSSIRWLLTICFTGVLGVALSGCRLVDVTFRISNKTPMVGEIVTFTPSVVVNGDDDRDPGRGQESEEKSGASKTAMTPTQMALSKNLARLEWNLGNGTLITAHDLRAVTTTYARPGTFTVMLTAISISGARDSETKSVYVTAPPQGLLNDTGIVSAGVGLSNSDQSCAVTGSAAQDCAQGRDALARAGYLSKIGGGFGGFDYTKVCNSGQIAGQGTCPFNPSLGAGANEWACTKDNLTGLVWEVKLGSGSGIRDRNNTFTNLGNGNSDDASGYVSAVNQLQLCGFKDWRVPTRDELIGIVNASIRDPGYTVDPTYFPDPPINILSYMWTASINAASNGGAAWRVGFFSGGIDDADVSTHHYLRLVQGQSVTPSIRFETRTFANAPEVIDRSTGLVWQRCSDGQYWANGTCNGNPILYTWPEALARAQAIAVQTGVAWRMPNFKELLSIADASIGVGPTTNPIAFPGSINAEYWSNSDYATSLPILAWSVNQSQPRSSPSNYLVHASPRTSTFAIRLVRVN